MPYFKNQEIRIFFSTFDRSIKDRDKMYEIFEIIYKLKYCEL